MKFKSAVLGLAGATLALTAWAQETKREVKQGTVVYATKDQLVVRATDGTVKVFPVAPGRTFNVDGKEIAVADLKPGTKLTQTITTTSTPRNVTSTRNVSGTVTQVMAPWVTVRLASGEMKRYKAPDGMKFNVEGNPNATVFDLRQGMKVSAHVVTTTPEVDVTQKTSVAGVAPPAPKPTVMAARQPEVAILFEEVDVIVPVAAAVPPPRAAAPQAAAPEPAAQRLPKTASPLPLLGISGLLLTAAGAALRFRRSRVG